MLMSTATTKLPPTALLTAAGLVGGFASARYSGNRALGGTVFALAGAAAGRDWLRRQGPATAALLGAGYLAAMGASHPLAKYLGPWGSVLAVTAATSTAAYLVNDCR